MHSLAMAQDIMEAALTEARKRKAKRIKVISVKIGDGHFDESDSLQFCLEAEAKGTIAEGAQIEVEFAGTTAMCRECAHVFPVKEHLSVCTPCGDRNTEILGKEKPLQVTLKLD